MKKPHRRTVLTIARAAAAALLVGHALVATAQPRFPERPIHIIVPASPGSTLDVIARLVGERVSKSLSQPVVVENKVGASGIIAYEYLARAKSDGYTLGMVQAGFVSNRFLYKAAKYDEFKDYAPVATVARSPMLLVARGDYPAANLPDLRQLSKAKPGALTYASINGANYMNTELARKQLDLDIRNIAYKDAGQAMSDVMAGHIDTYLAAYNAAAPMLRSGKLKAYVTLGNDRITALPGVPAAHELGMAVDINTWAGVLAPAGTPGAVLTTLHEAFSRVVDEPDIRSRLVAAGYEPYNLSPAAFTQMMQREIATYAQVAKELGVQPE